MSQVRPGLGLYFCLGKLLNFRPPERLASKEPGEGVDLGVAEISKWRAGLFFQKKKKEIAVWLELYLSIYVSVLRTASCRAIHVSSVQKGAHTHLLILYSKTAALAKFYETSQVKFPAFKTSSFTQITFLTSGKEYLIILIFNIFKVHILAGQRM